MSLPSRQELEQWTDEELRAIGIWEPPPRAHTCRSPLCQICRSTPSKAYRLLDADGSERRRSSIPWAPGTSPPEVIYFGLRAYRLSSAPDTGPLVYRQATVYRADDECLFILGEQPGTEEDAKVAQLRAAPAALALAARWIRDRIAGSEQAARRLRAAYRSSPYAIGCELVARLEDAAAERCRKLLALLEVP